MISHRFVNLAANERSWTERHWAICVMDDVVEHGGPACEKYKEFFIPLFNSGLQSVQPEIRQASAYGFGVLAQFGGPNFASHCATCVPLLIQIIQAPDSRSDENICATENAISAVSKILQFNSSAVSCLPSSHLISTCIPNIFLTSGQCKRVIAIMVIMATYLGR